MFRLLTKKYYYSAPHSLQFKEIRWFRIKIAVIVLSLVISCLALILGINHLYYDLLGFDRMNELISENQILKAQLTDLSSRARNLESVLDELNQQGDQFRLLVDLPKLDDDIKVSGVGGTNTELDIHVNSEDASSILLSTSEILNKLTAETKIQNQSYQEIINKYEYNKGYFKSIPSIKPIDGYYSPNGFGMRVHPILGKPRLHEGIDIINDVGTSIIATGDGVIEVAGRSEAGYGTIILINHGYGFQTFYAHLSRVLVREGQRVKRGDVIAKSGRSGLVSGPHLHYEVRYKGIRQNPIDFFFNDISSRNININ